MSRIKFRSALVAVVAVSTFACVASTDPADPEGAHQEALTSTVSTGHGRIDTRLPFPPPDAQYCPRPATEPFGTPQCSRTALLLPSKYDTELAELGCSKPFVESPGAGSGFAYVVAALCPDNAATRNAAASHTPYQSVNDWYCTPCVPKVPAGQIYLFLDAPPGPGCPSGCGHTAF